MRPQFEAGDTVQFTFVSSIAPDTSPRFTITGSGNAVINSLTAIQSGGSSTQFYALVTMPNSSDGSYIAEWYALKTAGGDTFPFYKRMLFNVVRTKWSA